MSEKLDIAVRTIRDKARELREAFGDQGRALALEWAAATVEEAVRADSNDRLTLKEASAASGYSEGHLARMVRNGTIPDLRAPGSKGQIRIPASALPSKPNPLHIHATDEHGLASRLLGAEEA